MPRATHATDSIAESEFGQRADTFRLRDSGGIRWAGGNQAFHSPPPALPGAAGRGSLTSSVGRRERTTPSPAAAGPPVQRAGGPHRVGR
jgi:hypothetical protein